MVDKLCSVEEREVVREEGEAIISSIFLDSEAIY